MLKDLATDTKLREENLSKSDNFSNSKGNGENGTGQKHSLFID